MVEHPCLKCNKQVKKNCKAVQCSFCEYWVHIECGDISEVLYKEMFKRADTHGHFWVCMSCKSTSFVFRKQLDQLTERVGNVESRIQKTDDNVSKVTDDVSTMKERIGNLEDSRAADETRFQNNLLDELDTRENKKTNLVFHGIPESTSDRAEERKEADSLAVLDISKTIKLKLNMERDMKFMTRLGAIRDRDESANPRPLLVGWNEEETKKSILSNARYLKGSKFEKVSIVPDLTKLQRDKEERLRKEAESLNSKLSREDSLNFEWRLVGPRGARRLHKARIRQQHQAGKRPQHNNSRSKRKDHPTDSEEEPSTLNQAKKHSA